jgi:hypothetical protein
MDMAYECTCGGCEKEFESKEELIAHIRRIGLAA